MKGKKPRKSRCTGSRISAANQSSRENKGKALVYQERFELPGTRHEFRVIRLWEVPYQPLLESPGLFPFAVLSQETNREMVLGEVAKRIEAIGDRTNKNNIAASTAIPFVTT